MSLDTADDFEYAEDMIGLLQAAIEKALLESDIDLDSDAGKALVTALAVAKEYCRPSCGANGDPTSTECGEDTCACLCGHADYEKETFLEDGDDDDE